ncbi:PTS sugar transporter subunit IIB, partial [Streptococcus suis]
QIYEFAQKEIDVLLLGPKLKFLLKDYKSKFEQTIKVDAINMMYYGVMNGAKVIEAALKMMDG